MKRIFTLIAILSLYIGFALTGGAWSARAQGGAALEFGYADRSLPQVGIGTGPAKPISMAIKLPKMQGNVIKGMTFFIAGDDEGRYHSVFVVSAADNKVKYIESVKFTLGWNTVTFQTPFAVNDDADYYVGYQLMTRKDKNPMGFEQAAGARVPGSTYFEVGSLSFSAGERLDLAEFSEPSVGNPLLFARVEDRASRLKQLAALISATLPEGTLTAGATIPVTLSVRNLGTEAITSIELESQFGIEPKAQKIVNGLNIPAGATKTVTFSVVAPARGAGMLSVAALKVNGTTQPFAHITREAPYQVKGQTSWARKTMLIERFTTERCVNCPGSEPMLKALVERMKQDGMDVSIIAHHAGYYTDVFTKQESESLLPYSFNMSGGFAPALMINRVPDAQRSGYLAGSYTADPARNKNYATAKDEMQVLRFTELSAADVNGRAHLTIKGETGAIDASNLYITVVVTESEVPSVSQAGATKDFIHHNVARLFVTSQFGEQIKLKPDGTFEVVLPDVRPDEAWRKEHLDIVVFAHKDIRGQDHTSRQVYSSGTIPWPGTTRAIEDVTAVETPKVYVRNGYIQVDADVETVRVYDLAGRLLDHKTQLPRGVYVVSLKAMGKVTAQKVVVD